MTYLLPLERHKCAMNPLKSAKNTHMPTITQRQTAKGKTRYRVEIVKKAMVRLYTVKAKLLELID